MLTLWGTSDTPCHTKNDEIVLDNAVMFGLPYKHSNLINSRSLISNAQVGALSGVDEKLPRCKRATAGEMQSQYSIRVGVIAVSQLGLTI